MSKPGSAQDQEDQESATRSRLEWTMIGAGLAGLLSLIAIAFSIVALASKTPTPASTTQNVAAAGAAGAALTPAVAPLSMTVAIKADDEHGKLGPDGQWHDAFLPAMYTIKAGQKVTMTFVNYDGGPHTFTSPGMGVNEIIGGGGSLTAPKTTTVTFTAPTKPGTYHWWCATPCDPWAMAHDGYMRGLVNVTA